MHWMEIAWAQVGVAETSGPQATPEIVAYFRDAGRPDVTSDETAWCAAAYGAILARAGIKIALPPERRLLARAYLDHGTPLDGPRMGCGVILRRPAGGPTAGHVGFVTGWDEERVHVLGGNQGDKVSVAPFPRADVLGWRWPAPAATPADLDAAGSRITSLARRQQLDAGKATTAGTSGPVVPASAPPSLPKPAELAVEVSSFQAALETAQSFAGFVQAKWPWVAVGLAAYWGGRMLYTGWLIRRARTDDHNSGDNTARVLPAAPAQEA